MSDRSSRSRTPRHLVTPPPSIQPVATVRSPGNSTPRGTGTRGRGASDSGTKRGRGRGGSRTSKRRGAPANASDLGNRTRGIHCTCIMCNADWHPGAPWGEVVTSTKDGVVVTEGIGDFCHKRLPIGNAFPLSPQDLTDNAQNSDVAARIDEAHSRNIGDLPPLREKDKVCKDDTIFFEGGRHVMLLTAGEIAKMAGRDTCPQYAVEGVPIVQMRKEKDGTEWEDVYVFPDPERPGRRGWIGQRQQARLTTNTMNASGHLWQGQGDMFFRKALAEHSEDTGAPEALLKHSTYVKTINDVLERLGKPNSGDDQVMDSASASLKRSSSALQLPATEMDPVADTSKGSSGSKAALALFGIKQGSTKPRTSSPPTVLTPTKATTSAARNSSQDASLVADDDTVAAPGSPGAFSSASVTSSNILQLIAGDDKGDSFAKRWKQECPESLILLDEVDGRTIEGLSRAVARLKKLAETDPLKKVVSVDMERYLERVKHCQKYALSKIVNYTRDEVNAAVSKILSWGGSVQIGPSYHLCLLSMAVKHQAQDKSKLMEMLRRLVPLSSGRALNPLDVYLGSVDCPMEDKTLLFERLTSRMVFTTLIHDGHTSAALVQQGASTLLQEFGKVDVVTAEESLTACKATAEQVGTFLTVLYNGSMNPESMDHVLQVEAKGKQEQGDGSMQQLVGRAVIENGWWNERLEQYKRVAKNIQTSGDQVIDLAGKVTAMADQAKLSGDDFKVIKDAAKLMASLGSRVPLDNPEQSYLIDAIPALLKKAYTKFSQDGQKTKGGSIQDASLLLPLEQAITAAREAYPESQDVVWVEHNLSELRTELMAAGDLEKLKTKIESISKADISKIDSSMLSELDDLISPCLAFDYDAHPKSAAVLSKFMVFLLSNAFAYEDKPDNLTYMVQPHFVTAAGKFVMLLKKAGAPQFEHLVAEARATKSLGDVLQQEDKKDVQALYDEGQSNGFSLCMQLSAEIKKLHLATKLVDPKQAEAIAHLTAAGVNFEARAQDVVSKVYSRRQESMKATLDAAVAALADKVYFGEGKDKSWDHDLPKTAKQDTIFAKAAETCLKTPVEELDKLITTLSKAWLFRDL